VVLEQVLLAVAVVQVVIVLMLQVKTLVAVHRLNQHCF
jgi:hypothetical protein